MAGTNPFRRKPPLELASPTSAEHIDASSSIRSEASIPPIDTDLTRSNKAKVVKTVRIISPHSADSEPEDLGFTSAESSRQPLFSPPPQQTSFGPDTALAGEDPFGADSEEGDSAIDDEVTLQNTIQNVGSTGKRSVNEVLSGAPANPFKKTLATLEGPSVKTDGGNEDLAQQEGAVFSRPQYDVEDFAKLLLTGEKHVIKSPMSRAPTISFGQPSSGDSSSNTDTSSLSRHSLFEPTNSLLTESPRTSRDPSPSEEDRQRAAVAEERSQKVKPIAPPHRHGRRVKGGMSHVEGSENTSPLREHPSFTTEATHETLPSSKSAPPEKSLAQDSFPSAIGTANTRKSSSNSPEDEIPLQKTTKRIVPPPPPAPRKTGQSRPTSMVGPADYRTNSFDKSHLDSYESSSSPGLNASSAPTPPPPRRTGTIRGASSSSIPSLASAASNSDHSTAEDSRAALKSRPSVPSTRSPTVSAVKNMPHSPPAAGSPARVAPQPPPRRRGSSQSSYTPSRLSGDYRSMVTERLRSDSGASSISQLNIVPTESTNEAKSESKGELSTEKRDIMADLTALQKEVDELRGKIR